MDLFIRPHTGGVWATSEGERMRECKRKKGRERERQRKREIQNIAWLVFMG